MEDEERVPLRAVGLREECPPRTQGFEDTKKKANFSQRNRYRMISRICGIWETPPKNIGEGKEK